MAGWAGEPGRAAAVAGGGRWMLVATGALAGQVRVLTAGGRGEVGWRRTACTSIPQLKLQPSHLQSTFLHCSYLPAVCMLAAQLYSCSSAGTDRSMDQTRRS
jgi:hypothetical protein